MADAGNVCTHFVSGLLPALARLGALGDFYLQLVRIDGIFGRYAKTTRSDLFDGRAPAVTIGQRNISLRIFSPFTGVASSPKSVQGNGNGFMRLFADGAKRHGG